MTSWNSRQAARRRKIHEVEDTDYRIPQESIADLKEEFRLEAVMEPIQASFAVCPRSQRQEFLRRLTPGQRAFLFYPGLVAEVCIGGIHEYFWNSTGDDAELALEGLLTVGARKYAAILQAAMHLFKDAKVLRNRRLRQKALARISPEDTYERFDKPFFQLNDKARTSLHRLCETYLKRHREEFFLPPGQSPPVCAVVLDYRVSRKKAARLRGEKLHWALIEPIWDDYWEALKIDKETGLKFFLKLSPGQRSLVAIDILNKQILHMGGFRGFLTLFGAYLVAPEVETGYRRIEATPYASSLERSLKQVVGVAGANSAIGGSRTRAC